MRTVLERAERGAAALAASGGGAARRKRVLHFICEGDIGGQERALYQLLKAFRGDDEVSCAVALGRDEGYYVEKIRALGVPILYMNLKGGFSFRFDRALLRQMRTYDIHHLPDPSPNYMLYSMLAGRGVRRVFTRRGGMVPPDVRGKKRVKLAVQRRLARLSMDGFSGNTANAVDSLRRQYGVRDRDVVVLYNGIAFELLDPKRPAAEVRAEHGLRPAEFAVGTACRLVDLKRVDLLIRAFARSRIEGKRLVIFGDGPARAALEALVADLGLRDRVVFTGVVNEMADHYPALDAFVLASTDAESFGNAVVEAMYARVPSAVMADSPGLLEHVHHLRTGYVAQDEEDLARVLERIHADPREAAGIAERASGYVVGKYSTARMVESHKALYRWVLREAPSPWPPGR